MLNDDRQKSLWDICENNHLGNRQSTEARRSIDASEIRNRVLDYIRSQGESGAICEEVEKALQLSHQTASARCSELKKEKLVTERGVRKTQSGRNAGVLIARREKAFWKREDTE